MARDNTIETQTIALSSSDKSATFEGGISELYVTADTDCKIDFDTATDAGSFLIKANLSPLRIEFKMGFVSQVHAVGTSGTLYLIGVRT